MPLLSVVTVTYNAAGSVERSLRSISDQTSKDYESVVVDGCSKDDTLAIVHDYRDRLAASLVVSEPDKGLYDAMNKGLIQASGRYVLFLNAGDVFHDERVIEDFGNFIRRQASDPVMVYGHTAVIMHDGKLFSRWVRPLRYIRHGQPTIHQSVFFRRDVHLEHPYRYRDFPISSDYASMGSIQKNHPDEVRIWDRIVADFHNDPKSVTNRNLRQRVIDAWRIQREVLAVPMPARTLSALRRIVVYAFYNWRRPR